MKLKKCADVKEYQISVISYQEAKRRTIVGVRSSEPTLCRSRKGWGTLKFIRGEPLDRKLDSRLIHKCPNVARQITSLTSLSR